MVGSAVFCLSGFVGCFIFFVPFLFAVLHLVLRLFKKLRGNIVSAIAVTFAGHDFSLPFYLLTSIVLRIILSSFIIFLPCKLTKQNLLLCQFASTLFEVSRLTQM